MIVAAYIMVSFIKDLLDGHRMIYGFRIDNGRRYDCGVSSSCGPIKQHAIGISRGLYITYVAGAIRALINVSEGMS